MEYYSAGRNDDITQFAAAWMDLGKIMPVTQKGEIQNDLSNM